MDINFQQFLFWSDIQNGRKETEIFLKYQLDGEHKKRSQINNLLLIKNPQFLFHPHETW